ncbi:MULTISPECIES: ROK family transcriptional regulator [unclassified Agrobacterium]|jgi:predicted NBD/HSP70 family sugar kinase|uniref:ROK family transcriptional regulator n=1 Tax=unclassified Agrobacterium TaxID=2632611 RepID=UPI00244CBFA3|nr:MULTISPECIES: ROK family transcriptional regulator [unclassified Agrobacterium]MDH0616257.1 ROK family transcriptional regulator [Agrobacterium sp. GD03872]MDH0698892.1 ROK family transcriptional regulator [Agrobacterium sp. GD03871]MDH1060996.1 ROK family transcriptional regulator [Agrobacterium sp. GD03992]MDH2211588.1 ROK family transcriptional regulator [Agrobacterium sp. GD03643]MDH2221165.1 ROK family transcriptional regulator [Agrobacterium sp. GD03638]
MASTTSGQGSTAREWQGDLNAIKTSAALLSLVGSGRARSRSALTELSGLSRATVHQKLAGLIDAGLIRETEETLPSGGRPTRALDLNRDFAVVLCADIGEQHIRVAVTDLQPRILAEISETFDILLGPAVVLSWIEEQFEALLSRIGKTTGDVLGIGIGLPAPVDYANGRVVGPSVMVGWDNFEIRQYLEEKFSVPVYAENDVNLLALSDHRQRRTNVSEMVFVKVGTGIGSGIITEGRLYRGAQGAAGDIGHIQFAREPAPLCRCGKIGCVEARAAGWAIARELRKEGIEAHTARDVTRLVELGQPLAIHLVRESGRILGEVMTSLVSILNPQMIVIGGTLAVVNDHLLAGIRELVYKRSLPLATRELELVISPPDPDAGIMGAAILVVEEQMKAQNVETVILRHSAHPALK